MFDKKTTIIFIVWCVMAVVSFITGFFLPLLPKIINIAFGSMNLLIIGAWLASIVEGKIEYRKQQKLLKEQKKENV